jgi:hypothetical protein
VEGKTCRGRPRLSFIQQIVSDAGCRNYTEMKRLQRVEGSGEPHQTDLQIENDDDDDDDDDDECVCVCKYIHTHRIITFSKVFGISVLLHF